MATATLTTKAYSNLTNVETDRVLLHPRPYERCAGFFVLVPLLPKPAPLKPLPAEIWRKVLTMAMYEDDSIDKLWVPKGTPQTGAKLKGRTGKDEVWSKWDLTLVCKDLKNVVLPLLYANCKLRTILALEKFTLHLHTSDQKWDSIRRIPYSTPGRWVQYLDLSELEVITRKEFCKADEFLTTLFPLLPFLSRLELSLSMQLSRRSMVSLGLRDGAQNLRCLNGVKYDATTVLSGEDPLTELVAYCNGLEELEVVGLGADETIMTASTTEIERSCLPFNLPHLHTLTILATPSSPLLLRLIQSPLPSLATVIITPYGDLQRPNSCVSDFLAEHGQTIRTLVLHTPNSWPIIRFPPPSPLLQFLPNLTSLSLELPGLTLDAPPLSTKHPLASLWISRPTSELRKELLRLLPHLPNLREVRARDVRWAKRGMSARALEAGFQGEMSAWRRILAPRRVRMLDTDGLEGTEL